MASEALYQELAKALSRPSKAYRATQAALNVPEQALGGYLEGSSIADKLKEQKFQNQTLSEALGGTLPKGTEGYGNLSVRQFKPTAELLTGLGAIQKMDQSEPVMTQEEALRRGTVPKGTKIVSPTGEDFVFIGNGSDGRPKVMNKKGQIMDATTFSSSLSNPTPSKPSTPYTRPILPKNSTMPTAATRSSSEFAKTLLPHIDRMDELIDQADQKGFIGPGAGRIFGQFLANKVGSTGNAEADQLLGELKANDSFLKSGALRVHFGSRGGQQMYDNFSNVLNSQKQSSAQLHGALKGIRSYMEGYAQAGSPEGYTPSSPTSDENNSGDPLGLFK